MSDCGNLLKLLKGPVLDGFNNDVIKGFCYFRIIASYYVEALP